ncbi:MAG: aminoglycoside 6-adenylyltransferase [Chloroflexota bacterium]
MRSEEEIYRLIHEFTDRDENIRAVVLNGSRANPNSRRDAFQDFDVACLVRDVHPYLRNSAIVRFFGDPMIVQLPEDMNRPLANGDSHYSYLMQFMDGNRIDLSFYPPSQWDRPTGDSLTVVLLDKDGLLANLPPSSEQDYLPKHPSNKAFQDCCNEFWWVSPYVAKGLWRGELIYAKSLLDDAVREQLIKMLVWYFGIKTDFKKSPGKHGKNFKDVFDPATMTEIEQTYADADFEHIWESLFVMGSLFRRIAREVAVRFGFEYPQGDDERVSAHLRHVKELPQDATEIY